MDDLNVKCCKVLKWPSDGDIGNEYFKIPSPIRKKFVIPYTPEWLPPRFLKFTTSEDWFRLLLNELQQSEDDEGNNLFIIFTDRFASVVSYIETPLEDRVKIAAEILEETRK